MLDEYRIVLARPEHLSAVPGIELAAAALFPLEDLSPEQRAVTTSADDLGIACSEGRLWVALAPDGRPSGFALADQLDGEAHLEELAVHPDHGRRGVGRRLVEAVLSWADSGGFDAVTLTTFRHLPFNAPFYESLGFEIVGPEGLTPGLSRVLEDEARKGLDRGNRVAMRRDSSG